jgi:hypothetical protein
LMIDVMPVGFDLRVCTDRRSAECNRHFGGCSERIDARSAHRWMPLGYRIA